MSRAETFDYIIIGAGSAGCVLANRLSADPAARVLLLEAGGRGRNPLFRLPMLMGKLFQSGIYNWHYHTEPEPHLNGRSLYWPRGKTLGGSSTINGMIYVRGNRHDYDRWAQLGLSEWSYEKVLPAFRRSEGHIERNDAFHNGEGELTVCRARSKSMLHDVFVEAGAEAGHPRNDDFNGPEQEGFGKFDFTIKDGKRWSTSFAFLRPVLHRKNLTVEIEALTQRILLENGRAVGVEFSQRGEVRTVRASREVILSAGTVNSPQLLMLSGLGPADELLSHGINPVHDLPGVGKNLQDHVDCVMAWECTKPVTLFGDLRADRLIWSVAEGMLFGRGVATTFPYEAGAFMKSRAELAAPDIQLHFMPALEKTANLHVPNPFRKRQAIEANHGFTLRVGPVNPESRGEITLRSADPAASPKIAANYLQSDFDLRTMIAGIRMTRDVIAQKAFDPYRGKELAPGPDVDSEADMTKWLRATAMTTFHPVGTCKMGNDPMAVVDARLKVRGIEGLRVADASIMPIISSGNTNAPAIMIAEKAADFILGEAPR
ncbi:GMC family oxidoreductase [Allomesorhizobium alhagi]|uniref:Choline dehydrogenase n=1 Tax=Mesorhizobium alhagi CCNWXJ12-2 TaxID=1107882 RepID=H0HZ07_9HYPH|nr:choline dehydrogenase [Mesorhizobium alhagi]EHK54036.1 choline dehydrogenase [Mesorhizobium alhagi CCNWXJ12-2]